MCLLSGNSMWIWAYQRERTIQPRRWDGEQRWNRDLDRIRVSVCVCVRVWACSIGWNSEAMWVSGSAQPQPAKQAVMWAKLPGASLISLSLSASHSLSVGSSPEERLTLYQQPSWRETHTTLRDNIKPNNHLLWERTTSTRECVFLISCYLCCIFCRFRNYSFVTVKL